MTTAVASNRPVNVSVDFNALEERLASFFIVLFWLVASYYLIVA